MTTTAQKGRLLSMQELAEKIAQLDTLHGVERAKAARYLVVVARASIAAAGDQGLWEATRPGVQDPAQGPTYLQVMRAMGYTHEGVICRSVAQHNARRRRAGL